MGGLVLGWQWEKWEWAWRGCLGLVALLFGLVACVVSKATRDSPSP